VKPATLPAGVSLRRVAEIVRNALRFGAGAWSEPGDAALREEPPALPLLPGDDAVLGLFALLRERGVEYLLVGGIALLRYTDGRNTEDIDLVMSLPDLRRVPEIALEEVNEFFARGRFHGLQVDILLTANPVFDGVRRSHGTLHRFAEQEVPTATPAGLVILKLYALTSLYRQGLFERVKLYESDLAALLYRHRPDVEAVFAFLRPHLDDGQHAELRLWVEWQLKEIERFGPRPPIGPNP
jgi:hypothetical protein